MNSSLIIIFASLMAFISCAYQPVATLDNFAGSQNVVVVSNTVFPATATSFLNTSSVLGGQRDLQVVISSGSSGQIFTSAVAANTLSVSAPCCGTGYTVYQLDGVDNSINVNQNGLNNFDLTYGSTGSAFKLTGTADIATNLNVTVYSSSGSSKYQLNIPTTSSSTDFYLPFANFVGAANFARVGAIEIYFNGNAMADSTFTFFGVVGESTSTTTVTRTRTPTPSRSPSHSRSPASHTRTPKPVKSASSDSSNDSSSAGLIYAVPTFVVVVLAALI